MTPLEQIKAGIEQNDMNKVAAGYKGITGESVSSQPVSLRNLLEQAISLLPTGTTMLEAMPDVEAKSVTKPKKDKSKAFTHTKMCELCGKNPAEHNTVENKGKSDELTLAVCNDCNPAK